MPNVFYLKRNKSCFDTLLHSLTSHARLALFPTTTQSVVSIILLLSYFKPQKFTVIPRMHACGLIIILKKAKCSKILIS